MTNKRFAYRLTKTIKNFAFPDFDKIDAMVQRCPNIMQATWNVIIVR